LAELLHRGTTSSYLGIFRLTPMKMHGGNAFCKAKHKIDDIEVKKPKLEFIMG
jgi:hypothetical protein